MPRRPRQWRMGPVPNRLRVGDQTPNDGKRRWRAPQEEAIRGGGASLRYLPQYSPELNPIESVFSPLRTFLRKAAERTIEGLQRCVRSYIRVLDPSECIG